MELDLRLAQYSDLPLLGNIRRQAIMAQPSSFWNEEEKLQAADAWENMDVQKNFAQYKIFVLGENTAFIGWKNNYLGYLFLLPEIQGNSFGIKLLNLAEEQIKKQYGDIWLFAHPYSEKFYEKHGFIKQVETENPFGTTLLYKFQKTFKL